MSTVVMVEKDGVACMAAETLTSYGCTIQPARYLHSPEKIIRVGDSYLGFVGWTVNLTVVESLIAGGLELPEVKTELELFEFARELHKRLKEDYFLNAGSAEGWESSEISLLLMNRNGLFGLHPNRSVERYQRFAAAGSGFRYALGAMYAAWEQDAPACDIARLGVEAGIEFDDASQGPITLKKLVLAP